MIAHASRCVIQFARAPHLGKVKTRLGQALGEAECLMVHQGLVEYTLRQLCGGAVSYTYFLSVSDSHSWFDQLSLHYDMTCINQVDGSLGEKIYRTFQWALASFDQVVVIGSDCPLLEKSHIEGLFDELSSGRLVSLIPAEDGGYVAIGLSCLSWHLFEGVVWGGDRVFSQTCDRIEALGWSWSAQGPLSDIDRPEDLKLLPVELAQKLKGWKAG